MTGPHPPTQDQTNSVVLPWPCASIFASSRGHGVEVGVGEFLGVTVTVGRAIVGDGPPVTGTGDLGVVVGVGVALAVGVGVPVGNGVSVGSDGSTGIAKAESGGTVTATAATTATSSGMNPKMSMHSRSSNSSDPRRFPAISNVPFPATCRAWEERHLDGG